MFDRFTDFILRHPVRILILLLLVTFILAPFLLRVPFVYEIADMFVSDDPSLEPLNRFRDRFGKDDNHVLIGWRDPQIYSESGLARVDRLTRRLEKLPIVDTVVSLTTVLDIAGTPDGFEVRPLVDRDRLARVDQEHLRQRLQEDPLWKNTLVGRNGDAVMLDVVLDEEKNEEGRINFFAALDEALAEEGGDFYIGGVPLIRMAFVDYMKNDQVKFIPLTGLVSFILLFLLFRSWKPVVFTFTTVMLTLVWMLGVMGLTGGTINIATTTLPSLMMVMGVAYAIHFTGRYLEESARRPDKQTAVRKTLRHLSLAIFMTSVTTTVGFLSLLIMKVKLVRMYGIYASVGLMVAFVLSVTFLPALCLLAKPMPAKAIDRFRSDFFRRYLRWNDGFVRRNKIAVIVVSFLLVAGAVYGITQIKVNARLMEEMNPKKPEYIANQFFEENLAGVIPINLMIEAEPGDFKKPEMLRKLLELREFASTKQIDNAVSFADLIALMNQAMHGGDPQQRKIPAFTEDDGGDERARRAIAEYLLLYEMSGDLSDLHKLVSPDFSSARIAIRSPDLGGSIFGPMQNDMVAKAHELFGEQVKVNPVGESVLAGHVVGKIVNDMTKSIVLASFVIVLVFFVLFRSLRLGLLAMIPNLMPIMVSMAALGFSGITLRTSIVMVFPISLGIAVDDTIHFIARWRAEVRQGKDTAEAITATYLGTGRAVVFTSLLLFCGFMLLATSNFIPTRNFGWLSALTMATALVGDLYLLPALLHLFKPQVR